MIQTVSAPEWFCLSAKRVLPLLNFIKRLEQAAALPHIGRIRIDFTHTKKMVSDGTLYFLASLDQMIMRYPHKYFCMIRPSDTIVEQVLQQLNITNMLHAKGRLNPAEFHQTVKHWHAASGHNVNAESASGVFSSFDGRITPELGKSVYTGVTEAMTNCFHHAYEDSLQPAEQLKWWLFSREYKQELQVVFCDLGIGIPVSLYRNSNNVNADWFAKLNQWLKLNREDGKIVNDALKIKAAIKIGQTRTKLGNRGKGLKQMVGVLDELSNHAAKVVINSGSGVYCRFPLENANPEFAHPLSNDKKSAIKGTMIYWSIPLIKKDSMQ